MKISIFPKAKALPESKEEKSKEAWYTSNPHAPVVVLIDNEDVLIDTLCNYAWSPSIFKGFRNQSNFESTDFMVLDIDNGMTITEAEKLVANMGVACLCLPSTSHTPNNHRFRLVFPLLTTIRSKPVFEATMNKLAEIFPADPSCVGDTARFFFGCKKTDGFWTEGDLLKPEKPVEIQKNISRNSLDFSDKVEVGEDIEDLVKALYGANKDKIPEQVDYWLRQAPTGLHGEWHNTCNSAIFTLGLQGVDFDTVEEVFRTIAPEELDKHDIYLLERAWNDGNTTRKEDNS